MSKPKGRKPTPAPVAPSAPARRPGLVGGLQHLATQASTFQKIAAAVIALISLTVLSATTVSRYAPWAWASDVVVMNSKVDLLTTVVLQSQIEDTENKIAALEAKRGKVGLTDGEAEYLRAKRRRLDELNMQLRGVGKK